MKFRTPIYFEDPEKDCIVTFGVSGWSSYFFSNIPKEYNIEELYKICDKMIPNNIKLTSPENEKLKYIKVYRFEKKIKYD